MALRRLDSRFALALVVASTVVALACSEGGYAPFAVGVATVVVAIALLAGALTGSLTRAAPERPLLAAAACLLALLAFTGLSLSWSGADDAAFVDAVRLAGYLGVFLLAGTVGGVGSGAPLLFGVATAGVVVAMIALSSRLLGLGAGDLEIVTELSSAAGRLSFPIGYWNALGALMALTAPALAWIAAGDRSRARRGLAIAGFAPVVLAIQMTSSRGALVALLVGLAVTVAHSASGRRAAAAIIVGFCGSVPPIVAAIGFASEVLESPASGSIGSGELLVGGVLLLSIAALAVLGDPLAERLSRARLLVPRVRARYLVAAVAAVAVTAVAIAGPSALIGDFRSPEPDTEIRTERAAGIFSTSGSGRAQFWETALDAFAEEPVRGIGAGSYEYFWNQNGSLLTPARNAHSEPLETLAELGAIGFACFAGFLAVAILAGMRRAREPGGSAAGALLGVFAAGLVGVSIDWTWQIPAVTVPILIAAGALTGSAFAGVGIRDASRQRPGRPAASAGLIAIALPSLWAAGVLAIAASQLAESEDALARGQLAEAAAAARTAAAVEPWSAEPWLRLAAIEQAADNYEAAFRDVSVAIDKAPDDPRAWVLATALQGALGRERAGIAYAQRVTRLIPD